MMSSEGLYPREFRGLFDVSIIFFQFFMHLDMIICFLLCCKVMSFPGLCGSEHVHMIDW